MKKCDRLAFQNFEVVQFGSPSGVVVFFFFFFFFVVVVFGGGYSRQNKDTKNHYVLINKLYLQVIGDELIQPVCLLNTYHRLYECGII